MGRNKGSGTLATEILAKAAVPHTLHSYGHNPRSHSFGLEAAAALEVDPSRIYKTLVVDTGDGLAVGVVPVTSSLSLKALASALGVKKLVMADPARAERSSGMVLGGISPIGQKRPLATVLDESMRGHATVLVSGGRRGLDIELAPSDLARLVHGTFAPISRSGPC